MASAPRQQQLGVFARAGFQELSFAREGVLALADESEVDAGALLRCFSVAADPDAALARVTEFRARHAGALAELNGEQWRRLVLLFGASPALGDFFVRHPRTLASLTKFGGRLISRQEAQRELLAAVKAEDHQQLIASLAGEAGAAALRVRYRELLAEVMLYDLERGVEGGATGAFDSVSFALSGLADAALEAGLAVARATLLSGDLGAPISRDLLTTTRLGIIAMGKCGAQELNVVSDVDVIFVAESSPTDGPADAGEQQDLDTTLRVATKLATETMRAIHDPGAEPPLWQVDANLRPEGKHGALVRTLGSLLSYYERWAKTWEFQALLKARPAAGDLELGAEFVEQTRELVWASSEREDFVGTVQRMRERVTERIDADEIEQQLKLGPGGLRDIEFSVQLLQLVHGRHDESLRVAGTLPALEALVNGGHVAREDGDRLASSYRQLRVLEHRLQLRHLRRTALMPTDDEGLRVLARSSHLVATGDRLQTLWRSLRGEVRELHLKIFYAPVLEAVAVAPGRGLSLTSDDVRTRLQSIGFRDPDGAMRHLVALTKGTSRAARIQRNLLPALLPWLAEGTDPDFGLLAFRRVSEANRDTPWYLRLLRDGTDAAERLTKVLSNSKFAAELLESIPEAVAWLEKDQLLRPVSLQTLHKEMRSLAARRENVADAADALRAVHRREILRIALGRLVFVIDDVQVAEGLDAAHSALLDALLFVVRRSHAGEDVPEGFEVALIAMGRFGGSEMGFGSDLDLLAVYRALPGESGEPSSGAQRYAERVMAEFRALVSDPRFIVDLDFDLRPEGKNGPIVRSLEAYRSYYERWSLTWEAQALLRARPVAGDARLGADFSHLADGIRYPESFDESDLREVRRIKARVEGERLARGADPRRHLKLGPGGISDVEWLVQLIQLRHGASVPELRTQSTLVALRAAVHAQLLAKSDRKLLEKSWLLASSIRSAAMLWSGRTSDSLPVDRRELEGIAGVLGLSFRSTTRLEERWFSASRRARRVFESEFFGYTEEPRFPSQVF